MSTSMDADELADALVHRGLIRARTRPVPESSADRPWYISAVLGFAGWLAGLFALSFIFAILGFSFGIDNAAGIAFAGLVMLAAAFGLYAGVRDTTFVDQLALALSIGGQLALMFAVGEATESAAATAALMVVMQCVLLFVLPNRMARTLAAFFACIAWVLTIRLAWWGDEIFGRVRESVPLATALGTWLVVWAPLIALAYALIAFEARWMADGSRRIARPAVSGLLAGLAIGTWLSEPFAGFQFSQPGASNDNWLALWPLLAAATALYAALCAYHLRDRALLGLAILGALLHVSQFYYLLGATLVTKSLIMLGVGVVLFAASWVLRQRRDDART